MNDLFSHLSELISWISSLKYEALSWSSILIAEDTDIEHSSQMIIPRSALSTPEEYFVRFDRHLDAGHSWINMNAAGILNNTLLVIIELPKYENTVPRDKVSVNLSGPFTKIAREPNWNASNHIKISG